MYCGIIGVGTSYWIVNNLMNCFILYTDVHDSSKELGENRFGGCSDVLEPSHTFQMTICYLIKLAWFMGVATPQT